MNANMIAIQSEITLFEISIYEDVHQQQEHSSVRNLNRKRPRRPGSHFIFCQSIAIRLPQTQNLRNVQMASKFNHSATAVNLDAGTAFPFYIRSYSLAGPAVHFIDFQTHLDSKNKTT